MFFNKKRVVIRAFTCRRDVASASILAKCLEFLGCEVMIASLRDFNRILRFWKPDVAIFNVIGGGYNIKKINSNIITVFLDGEGHLPDKDAYFTTFQKNPVLLKSIDMMLLWGDVVYNQIKGAFPNTDLNNMYVVGWPSLDFIRYRTSKKQKKSIGFVMRSPVINDHQGVPTVRTICNEGNLERTIVQCESFVASINCMKEVLEKTNYNISIRPHPLEQIDSYNQYKKHWFKEYASRVEIDETLALSEWLINQRIIISPTSTSSLEAYLLGIPIINIDELAGNADYNRDYFHLCAEWQNLAYLPKTLSEFINLVTSNTTTIKKDKVIDDQLQDYCNWNIMGSANLKAAKYIYNLASTNRKNTFIKAPTWIVNLVDNYSFWKEYKKNSLHPNLHYKKGFHKPVKNLNLIFEKIINDDLV